MIRLRNASRTVTFARLIAAGAVAIVLFASVWLLRYQHQSAGAFANDRTNRLERFGTQASEAVNAVPDPFWNTLELGLASASIAAAVPYEPTRDGSARWDLLNYEFAHLFASNPPCAMSLYVVADDPVATGSPASVDFLLNGRLAETMQLNGPKIPGDTYFEHAVSMQPIFYGPLYQPSGHVVPIRWNACAQQQWQVELRVHHARWKVVSLGVIAKSTPLRPQLTAPGDRVWVAAAVLVTAAMLAGFFALFFLLQLRYGSFAVAAALLTVLGATLTHDQWDFPVWVRYVDLLVFGHGNPVVLTAGSPFWAYLTTIAAPVIVATYALFNYGSNEVTALVLKLMMALAYGFSAYLISLAADARMRRLTFLLAILSPIGLYGLAGGYREVAGGFFAVAGVMLTLRGRYLLASIGFAAAGTISESLLPLILLPAARVSLDWRSSPRTALRAVLYAAFALGLVAVPWLTFPHDEVGKALAFRTGSYRFGGASWYSVIESYGMPMQFIREHGFLINVVSYALLASTCVAAYVRLLRRKGDPERERVKRLFFAFLGLEFAFFLCYTGVDPSTWYSLIVVTAVLTALDPFNPFPFVLTSMCGLAFYSIVGLGDFINWTYLWPMDAGLFGTLGHPEFVFVGLVNLLILGGWVAASLGNFRLLFGSRSLEFLAAFAAACVAATIFQYPEDVTFVLSFAAIEAFAIYSMMRIFQRRGGASGVRNLQFVAIPLGLCGAYLLWAQGLPLGTAAVGIALACLAWGGRIGLADLVALTGTFWIISTEPGGGWLSSAGYVLLDVVLVAALLKAHGRALRKRFLRRPKLGITRITIQWESGSRFRLDSNHNLPAPPEPVERPSEAKLLN